MSVLERPHYVIKPTELAEWLDQEPETWWMVEELSEALRRYKKDLFFYPVEPSSSGPLPAGQTIERQRLNELADRDNPHKRRTFLLTWSDREDEWLLVEYPSWKISELND
jgi:hypothetical protein